MKFYKTLNEQNSLVRIDKCDFNPTGGIEISEDEYNEILNGIKLTNEAAPDVPENNDGVLFGGDL